MYPSPILALLLSKTYKEKLALPIVLSETFSAIVSVKYVCSFPTPPTSLNFEKLKRRTVGPESRQFTVSKILSFARSDETVTARTRTEAKVFGMILPMITQFGNGRGKESSVSGAKQIRVSRTGSIVHRVGSKHRFRCALP